MYKQKYTSSHGINYFANEFLNMKNTILIFSECINF